MDALIAANTLILTMLTNAGNDENIFENPEKFDPYRWLNMSKDKNREVNKKLMFFGGGPRIFPGRLLSYQEMKTGLISMLEKYRFEKCENYSDVDDCFRTTVAPENLLVKVIKR